MKIAALALCLASTNAFAPRAASLLRTPTRVAQRGPRFVFPVDVMDPAMAALAGSASSAANAAHAGLEGIKDVGGTLLAFSDQVDFRAR